VPERWNWFDRLPKPVLFLLVDANSVRQVFETGSVETLRAGLVGSALTEFDHLKTPPYDRRPRLST